MMQMSPRMEQIVNVLWRAMKVMPVVGYVFILAGAPLVLRRKGYVLGSLAVILDILPVICLIKAAIEVYRGDIIPDLAPVADTATVIQFKTAKTTGFTRNSIAFQLHESFEIRETGEPIAA